jgi:dihydrofolate reductase
MSKLIYSAIMSLDGYVADAHGNFEWAEPDEEVHSFINDLQRSVGTHLLGRKMYEVLVAWDDADAFANASGYLQDFAALWQGTDKVVYSRTLESVSGGRTRIERNFDPQAVQQMKVQGDADITVGGPNLAEYAFKAGLVDECHLFVAPAVIGGGTRGLPNGVHLALQLQEERRFGSGMVYLRYRPKT